MDNVRFFDVRILTLDADEPERFLTSEEERSGRLLRFRIVDVLQYYISVGGDEARAKIRLLQTVGPAREFGKRTIHDVVSGEREVIMDLMRDRADFDARRSACRFWTYD